MTIVEPVTRGEAERRLAELLPGGGGGDLGSPDAILSRARAQGAAIVREQIGEVREVTLALAQRILRGLWELDEPILMVTHRVRCFRVDAARLLELVLDQYPVIGEHSFEGDQLFICTRSRRLVVWHHEAWAFDVQLAS